MSKRGEHVCIQFWCRSAQKPDYWNRRLLPLRCQRPRRRTTEGAEKFAPARKGQRGQRDSHRQQNSLAAFTRRYRSVVAAARRCRGTRAAPPTLLSGRRGCLQAACAVSVLKLIWVPRSRRPAGASGCRRRRVPVSDTSSLPGPAPITPGLFLATTGMRGRRIRLLNESPALCGVSPPKRSGSTSTSCRSVGRRDTAWTRRDHIRASSWPAATRSLRETVRPFHR